MDRPCPLVTRAECYSKEAREVRDTRVKPHKAKGSKMLNRSLLLSIRVAGLVRRGD